MTWFGGRTEGRCVCRLPPGAVRAWDVGLEVTDAAGTRQGGLSSQLLFVAEKAQRRGGGVLRGQLSRSAGETRREGEPDPLARPFRLRMRGDCSFAAVGFEADVGEGARNTIEGLLALLALGSHLTAEEMAAAGRSVQGE